MSASAVDHATPSPAGIGSNSRAARAHLQWMMWRQAAQERMGPRDQVLSLAATLSLGGVRLLHS